MSDRRRLVAAAIALAAVSASPAAALPVKQGPGAVPTKAPGPSVSFGRVAPNADALLVTFRDRPDRAAVERRLRNLGAVSPLVPEAGVWRLEPERRNAREAARRRYKVLAVEWPLARRSAERPAPADPLPIVPADPITDPLQSEQWMLASNGWQPDLTGRRPRPVIAVLDGGIDRDHPEWSGPDSPLLPGFTVFPGRSDANGDDWGITGHGTHVAGIAAAPANGIGIVGVAPGRGDGAQVIPVQVADRFGEFSDEALIRGIRYAVTQGAKVINISAGGEGSLRAFQETIYWATRRGAVVVAAVGNDGDGENVVNYPAAYRRVVGVGAQCGPELSFDCRTRYGVARFSNHNSTVDLVAPGVGILSTVPVRVTQDAVQPGYALKDGTSMAAPFVSGAVALVQAANGNSLSAFQAVRQLERTARDIGARGRDDRAGHGAVDLRAAVTTVAPPDDATEVNDDVRFLGRRATDLQVGGPRLVVQADIDAFDDPDDVYPVRVRRGERLRVELTTATGRAEAWVWDTGTRTVSDVGQNVKRHLIDYSGRPGRRQVVVIRAPRSGRYYINVYTSSAVTSYTLRAWTLR